MVKIKVSYSEEKELNEITNLLELKIDKIKIPKQNKGEYKKAYIEFKE